MVQGSKGKPRDRREFPLTERCLLAAGVVLFCVLVYRIDGWDVLASVRLVGWGIVLIVLQDILTVAANTAGWRVAFPVPRPPIPFSSSWSRALPGMR